MFLSKIWFILVTLIAGVAVTMALVAPRPAVQKLELLEGQRLDRAQYAADQMLKTDAHRKIDLAAGMGRDSQLSESLDSASRGGGELNVLRKTVQQRFRTLIPDLAKANMVMLMAADKNGRVIARVGADEQTFGDSVAGAEVVADALRGYMSDDVWGHGGKLMRIAAAPVFSRNHDRIVGAVVIGAETGMGLAEVWKTNLGVDIAILLHNKIITSTEQEAKLGNLGDLIEQRAQEITDAGRSRPIPIQSGRDRLLVVAAPFVGQASMQGAYYALVGKRPAHSDLASMIGNVSSDDLKWGNFPWIPIGGGVLGVLLIGLLLQMIEVERPLHELRREVKNLAHGAIARLADTSFRGRFGALARDINAAIERFTLAPEKPSEMASKDMNAILGGAGNASGATFDVAGDGSAFGNDPLPAFAPPPAPMFAPPPAPAFAPPPMPAFAPPPPAAFAPPPRPAPGFSPPAPFAAPAAPAPAAPAPSAPAEVFTSAAGEAVDEEEAHVRQVFQEFVSTKQRCGEPTAGLTLDKFREKLAGNKAQLMSKYNCRTVRFSVYIKDNKATLKATPIN